MFSRAVEFLLLVLRVIARPRNGVVLVGALYATATSIAAVTPVSDPDVWWVAAAGRQMLASGRVPTQNVFSFVEPAHPWIMHEWLLGPPYAWGLERVGPSVFPAITVALLAVDLALVLAATLGRARHVSTGLFMAFLAVAGFGVRFLSARPPHVALVFPLATALIAFAPSFGLASIAATALLEIVWTNTHGSFPLGIVLLVVAAVDGPRDRTRRLAAAALCAGATFINPYGLALHRFVWGYFRGQDGIYREIHKNIIEFGNLVTAWGGTVGPVDLVALAVIGTIAAFAVLRPPFRVRALFSLAMLALGAMQVRHLELAGLLTCVLLVPYVDACLDSRVAHWRLEEPAQPRWRRRAAAVILLPACALGAGLFAFQHARRTPDEWIAWGPTLVPALARVPDGAHLYIPFQWAGMAIAYAFPRGVQVFFDPRNDCYSAATFRAFNAFDSHRTAPAQIREQLATTGTDTALVEDDHALVAFLDREPGWALLARVQMLRVYRRQP